MRRSSPRTVSAGRSLSLVLVLVLVLGAVVALAAAGASSSAGSHLTPTRTHPRRPAPLTVLVEPGAGYGFVVTQINGARHRVHVEMYELSDPAVLGALERARHRGVVIEVLLDRAYHGKEVNAPAVVALWGSGVMVRWADPSVIAHEKAVCIDSVCDILTGNLTPTYYPSDRDVVVIDRQAALYIHAKAIVVDDTTAFVGSENFSSVSLNANRELGLVTRDPAVVGPVAAVMGRDMEER